MRQLSAILIVLIASATFSYAATANGGHNGIGVFSISATQKVSFSPGNLQFNAAQGTHRCADGTTQKGTWRFAENQWDYVGDAERGTVYENGVKCDNALISETYNGWVDLFGWGTSGWNSGANLYQPWSTSQSPSDYHPGGTYNSLVGEYAYADWGVYNEIGTDAAGTWRTLNKDEWDYLFNKRMNAIALLGLGNVNGINGLILLPDDWVCPAGLTFTFYIYSSSNNFAKNVYTADQWVQMEQSGAVFLPAAGGRNGTSVSMAGSFGHYWSTTHHNKDNSYYLNFSATNVDPLGRNWLYGFCVRLVSELGNTPQPHEGIEDIHVDTDKPVKVLHDGQIYVLKGDHIFTLQGQRVK